MRKLILWIAGVILSVSGFSQVTADIGIWGGASGYTGDIQGSNLTPNTLPAIGAYFRYNFHQRISARLMFLTGKVAMEGEFQNYPWKFDKAVQDLSLQGEVNYLKYMLGNRKASFTTYVTAGLGVMYFKYYLKPDEILLFNPRHNKGVEDAEQSAMALTLPVGMGFKFNVGKRLGLGMEYQLRKIFDDRLDDLDDPLAHYNQQGDEVTYTDFLHNNDWIGYLGVHLTYKIYLGSKPCPAYDIKN